VGYVARRADDRTAAWRAAGSPGAAGVRALPARSTFEGRRRHEHGALVGGARALSRPRTGGVGRRAAALAEDSWWTTQAAAGRGGGRSAPRGLGPSKDGLHVSAGGLGETTPPGTRGNQSRCQALRAARRGAGMAGLQGRTRALVAAVGARGAGMCERGAQAGNRRVIRGVRARLKNALVGGLGAITGRHVVLLPSEARSAAAILEVIAPYRVELPRLAIELGARGPGRLDAVLLGYEG